MTLQHKCPGILIAVIILILAFAGTAAAAAPTGSTGSADAALEPVIVEEKAYDGSATVGYLVDEATDLGPWGKRKLLDTPYSISVISRELIENAIGVGNINQLLKMMPNTITTSSAYNNHTHYSMTRGFTNAAAIDGLRIRNGGVNLADVERVEILSGLSGFMYGGGYVGGMTNYVLKRPTKEFYNQVTLGFEGRSQTYAHVDLGGPIDSNGKLGFRLNAYYSNGETALKYLDMEQSSVSLAMDWNITDNMVLQVDATHKELHQNGHPSGFFLLGWQQGDYRMPPPLDNGRMWGQKWNYVRSENTYVGGKFLWDINDHFSWRTAYRWQQYENAQKTTTNRFNLPHDGTWEVSNNWSAPSTYETHSVYSFMDVKFDTWALKHKLTFGYSGTYETVSGYEFGSGWYGYDGTSYGPGNQFYDQPAGLVTTADKGRHYDRNKYTYQSYIIGDEISLFDDKLTFMGGLNFTNLKTANYNVAGTKTAEYDESELSPSLSIMFKPIKNLSIYASYIEAFEPGAIVPDNPSQYVNAGEVLDPQVSEQYELGVKYMWRDVLLSAALFWIDQPHNIGEYQPDGRLRMANNGREMHRGFELSAQGKLFDSLTVMGSWTMFQAKLKEVDTRDHIGNTPYQTPTSMAKLYLEYELPWVNGLSLTGGAYYVGKQYTDDNNVFYTSPYTVFDLGARYNTSIQGVDTTFRLSCNNITDKRYWQRAYAGQLGEPRSFNFSVSVSF